MSQEQESSSSTQTAQDKQKETLKQLEAHNAQLEQAVRLLAAALPDPKQKEALEKLIAPPPKTSTINW